MLQPGEETPTATAREDDGLEATNGGGGGGSDAATLIGDEGAGAGGEDLGSGGSGGNRWPRQETLALLQIRSDMDAVFRDSSHKGPLWEEVSRKMAELGYRRTSKKCREKFENVYKYHKRTKDGRAGKSDGKSYRFFEQLEALEASNHPSSSLLPPVEAAVPIAMAMPPPRPPPPLLQQPITTATQPQVTVPSSAQQSLPFQQVMTPIRHISQPVHPPPPIQNVSNPINFQSSPSGTPSSSSSTSSDEEISGMGSKRKRKWKHFFEKLTRNVMAKQEDLQRKFLEAIEKKENERRARDETWKNREMARLKREHDILAQERSMAAAKDAALVSFLQKLSHQQQIPLPPIIVQSQPHPSPTPPPPPPPPRPTTPTYLPPVQTPAPVSQTPEANTCTAITPLATRQQHNVEPTRPNNGDPSGGYSPASSSRWPKAEIDALISLRTSMDHKYQENGPKGPLWEEISAAMRKLGYNRNAKRCKEKWENINKYFKKVKESNKRRRDDAKTCPYYHQLEALYREKSTKTSQPPPAGDTAAILAKPEQQWPLPAPRQDQEPGNDNMDYDDDEDGDDDDDDDGGFEIVASSNNAASMGGAAASAQNS